MARFSRIEVALKMKETGIVPVFYNPDIDICKKVLKACYEGGVRVFEFTNRGDFAHEVFAELVKFAAKELPDMIMGVGSVIDPGTTSLYIQLGANFIVSPLLNEDMAKVCNRRKVSWSPGCGSVSEISKAEELGAEVVKIFPGSQVGGPKFVAAVKGPMPWSNIMPTGGVDTSEDNLTAWFNAGAYCVGMGSQLVTKDIIMDGNYDKLREDVAKAIALVKKIRK
ncbi:MAG: bifunctional 4-hydroxy-2-oxoglutarate aldolase/2-dehydro-3-deoxy-phosphogluconate aldolase [Bacteroidales bacterium]|nr:bifunctional 4-hydroxy-2-oxoglutarate aldolase/2-dehydro-3-deoxy-phosphogluconate aldolase [Bacteroidales bacterium]